MAIQFNLLPWREAHRQKKAKEVKNLLVAAVFFALIASGLFYALETVRLSDHEKALSSISHQNNALKKKLDEKKRLDALKESLNKQIDAIEGLQANRSSVSHMVEELSIANNQELYLEKFSLTDGRVLITGIAENDLQISKFMTELVKSTWYQEPKLISIVTQDGFGEEVKRFTVSSMLLLPGSGLNKGK